MTASSRLWRVLYADESTSWAESSTSFDEGPLPIISPPSIDVDWPLVDNPAPHSYINQKTRGTRGPVGGTFTLEFLLTGLGSATTGSITANNLVTLLGRCLGNSSVGSVGTTATGGTATAPLLTAGTYADGSLCRIGTLGDGRGEGQFYRVNVGTGGTFTLENAMPAAPNNGDVVYAPALIYPEEDPTADSVTSMRFLVQSGNDQWSFHGCWAQSISISGLAPRELPRVSITFGLSRLEHRNSTFPGSAPTHYGGAPVAGGTCHVQTVGTTTRNVRTLRNLSVDLNLQTSPQYGDGGVDEHQAIIGCTRSMVDCLVTMTHAAEAAGTHTYADEWDTDENSAVNKHICCTLSTTDGRAVGLYLPNAQIETSYPTQGEQDGMNTVTFAYRSGTADSSVTNGTTSLELANFLLGIG